jgi:hypothetical protein
VEKLVFLVIVGNEVGVEVGAGLGVAEGVGLGVAEGVGLGVAEGVGLGVAEGVGLGVAEGVGLGVAEGVGLGVAATFTPLLQTSFLPDLIHVNLYPLTIDVVFNLVQVPPALAVAATARFAGNTEARRITAKAGASRRIGKY